MRIQRRGHVLLVLWQSKQEGWIHTLWIDLLHPNRSRKLILG
jgi:hypothetical protein